MDERKKRKLKEQLELQARTIVSQDNDAKLAVSAISSCIALMTAAEGIDAQALSKDEAEQIRACLLGLSGKINAVYKASGGIAADDTAAALEKAQKKITQAQSEENEIKSKLAAAERKIADMSEKKTAMKIELQAAKKALEIISRDCEELRSKENDAKEKTAKLEKEAAELRASIRDFDSDVEALVKETVRAKETYAELTASYKELGRIQKGIEAEGFTDMKSFAEHFREMNEKSEALMKEYSAKLSALLADIEAFQDEIRARSMPKGAVNA